MYVRLIIVAPADKLHMKVFQVRRMKCLVGLNVALDPQSSVHRASLVPVLAPQTANTLLKAVSSSPNAVRLVQVGVICGCDICVLGIVASNRCWVAVVEHALAFLLLVFFSESRGVLHLDSTVIVDLVGAECAVESKRVALALNIVWIVVLL